MDPLPLDPQGYAGTYKMIGGRSSLDMVNTVSWPGTGRRHDWLGTAANVAAWIEATGLPLPRRSIDPAGAAAIRDAVAEIVVPAAEGSTPPSGAVDRFNRLLGQALARRRLDAGSLTWTWAPPPETVAEALHPVVLDAAHLLSHGDRRRLRLCPACRWVFEDSSRNGRRRWCDMADCGSRAKARQYYQRHHG